ncbi:MAG: hypothetical protein FJ267_06050, partial [Planctomycetes bacterium]|nr:hypothetical protein [Planctomycetota bacterium]
MAIGSFSNYNNARLANTGVFVAPSITVMVIKKQPRINEFTKHLREGIEELSTKRVLSFLQKSWTTLVDPNREARLDEAVLETHRNLSRQRDKFDFLTTVADLDLNEQDRREVGIRLFKKCISRAWSDDSISDNETRSLKWIAAKIGLSESEAAAIQWDFTETVFAKKLSTAFMDGILDDSEYTELTRITLTCGASPADFFRFSFRNQSEGFIRNLFVRVLEDGKLDQQEWDMLMETIKRLGINKNEFQEMVHVP